MEVKTKNVHFYVQRDTSFATAEVIPFELAPLNEGGAFDLKSGIFTTPVGGIYHFDFSALNDKSSVEATIVYLRVNGAIVCSTASQDTVGYNTVSLTASLRLKANDQVFLTNGNSNGMLFDVSTRHYTQFTGWLIEEDLI